MYLSVYRKCYLISIYANNCLFCSTISSTLNSLAAVTYEDFLSKISFFRNMGDFGQTCTYKTLCELLMHSDEIRLVEENMIIMHKLLLFYFCSRDVWSYLRSIGVFCGTLWKYLPSSNYGGWGGNRGSGICLFNGGLHALRE